MAPKSISNKVFNRFRKRYKELESKLQKGCEIKEETKTRINQILGKIKQGQAENEEVIEANKLITDALDEIKQFGSVRDVVMGKTVMDEGNRLNMNRTVIFLDGKGYIVFIKSGKDNHYNLAGKDHYNEPGRHSFWYEYSNGNLVLHPAASEDDNRLNAWNALFEDKNSNLKRQIMGYIRFFN
ncbi:MAG: hypothetical protein ACLFNK_01885 [Candidatus Woesearchaeota archaeon]